MPSKEISEELLHGSVRELGNQLRAGRISSLALTDAYLERLEKLGPKLGAVVTVTAIWRSRKRGLPTKNSAPAATVGPSTESRTA